MIAERISGVLLHVTSLPSKGWVGDFGPEAYRFVDFLVLAKQQLWQVLPLSPAGYGGSPYSALSAFAGNPLLISLEFLVRDGWIPPERLQGEFEESSAEVGACDFSRAAAYKMPIIEEAAANFLDRGSQEERDRFQQFSQENASWLTDFALYSMLRRRFGSQSWNHWPQEFARRDHAAISALMNENGREFSMEQVVQFFFHEQWAALRAYCAERQVRILGDVAIFVNYDSADVWTHPEIFELDENLLPERVAGVPPDYFSATGQRWGNPVYKWSLLQAHGFDWWVSRIRRALALYDQIRLDHFRGFEAYWSIPAQEPTAVNGQWVKAPGQALFTRLKEDLGDLPFVAEDLGVITREVEELRELFGFPGMRVLQFGFGDRESRLHLPHRYVERLVAYTGTHDNNTTLGWWRDEASEAERANIETYLHPMSNGGDLVWAMIKAAANSVASTCIFPMQDILQLGSEARMNRPAEATGNWTWRFRSDALQSNLALQVARVMEMADRGRLDESV
ncbi:MAG: 4-alpha-glucanotransferase [Acidobacteriaceae bacterium]